MTLALPNYFLADLPPEAELTAGMVTEACRTLRRNRDQYLRDRPTTAVIDLLAAVAEEWRSAESPFRQIALAHGPAATGFSAPTLAAGLDGFFAGLTHAHLEALVAQELGHANRLDALVSTAPEERHSRAGMAFGPPLIAHIAAGNLPPPTLTSMVLGLLTRSAQFVKCPRDAAFLPRLFAHSLYEADAKIGACLEVASWPGGDPFLEDALFAEAECITATGGDAAIATIRQRVPHGRRFVGYGHRVSFGYVTREKLTALSAKRVAAEATRDICAWDQLGCLSPHVIFAETGSALTPDVFAEILAGQLAAHEAVAPRGPLSLEESARKARVSSAVGRTPMVSRKARRINSESVARGLGGTFKLRSFFRTRSSIKFRRGASAKTGAGISFVNGTVTVAMAMRLRYHAVMAPSPWPTIFTWP